MEETRPEGREEETARSPSSPTPVVPEEQEAPPGGEVDQARASDASPHEEVATEIPLSPEEVLSPLSEGEDAPASSESGDKGKANKSAERDVAEEASQAEEVGAADEGETGEVGEVRVPTEEDEGEEVGKADAEEADEVPPSPETATPEEGESPSELSDPAPQPPLRRPHPIPVFEVASTTVVLSPPGPTETAPEPAPNAEAGGGEAAAVAGETAPPGPDPVGAIVEDIVQAGSGRILTVAPADRAAPPPPPQQQVAPRRKRLRLPVESCPATEPQEWDGDTESPLRPVERAAREREERERAMTARERRQTRRHPELEDYEPRFLNRPRSVTPPGPPNRDRSPAPTAGPSRPSAAPEVQPRFVPRGRGMLFGDLVEVPTNPTIDPPPYSCFNCWRMGHSRHRCPRPAVATYCYNCGRRGVTLRTCPRCEMPHRLHMEGRAAALRMGPPRPQGEHLGARRVEDELRPAGGVVRLEEWPHMGIAAEALRAVGEMRRNAGEEIEVTVVRAVVRGHSATDGRRDQQ